jgi:rRNA-processing protein FCF1
MSPTLRLLPTSPVVDTNILFDFLVWRFHTETHTGIHPSLSGHLSSKPLDGLKWFLDAAKPIQTTFHVVAELHGLTKKKTQKKPEWTSLTRGSFWRFVREELTQIQLAEHPVRITDMNPEDLAQLGPTDASILALAMRLDAVVLTEDGPLGERCTAREIRVLNYDEVLGLWKQNIT